MVVGRVFVGRWYSEGNANWDPKCHFFLGGGGCKSAGEDALCPGKRGYKVGRALWGVRGAGNTHKVDGWGR